MLSSFNLLLLAELLTVVIVALQLFKRDENKINAFTSSSNVICTDVNRAIIVLNLLIWLVTELPSPIFRLTSLRIKYILLAAYDFSYIFDNACIKSTVIFSFMMLNTANLTTPILTAPCWLTFALLRVDTTSSDTGSPLPSNFSILTFSSSNAFWRKLLLPLTKAPTSFHKSSHYFSKQRFPRRKRNQIFSDVEDQTML